MCHNRYIEYNEYSFMYFITIYFFLIIKIKNIYVLKIFCVNFKIFCAISEI